ISLDLVRPEHARTRTLRLQRLRLELASQALAAAALADLARLLVAEPESLGQFRARVEPEAWLALGQALQARPDGGAADAFATAFARLPGDRVDPVLLYVVAGPARAIAADGRRDEAIALLRA